MMPNKRTLLKTHTKPIRVHLTEGGYMKLKIWQIHTGEYISEIIEELIQKHLN